MNLTILKEEVQDFINKNLQTDLNKLILKGSPFYDVNVQELAQQITGKLKAKEKLPTWYRTPKIFYPPKLNIEQTSSEATAQYKAKLLKGQSCLDLTGGFGVDTVAFSKQFDHVLHCEIQEELSSIATYNAKILGAHNIDFAAADGIDYLESCTKVFDLIYIDPSRRNEKKGKVFLLEDCLPNVPSVLDNLFKKTKSVLIKYSPMLDIQMGIQSLNFVQAVHVVAVDNEVKELLFLLCPKENESIPIKTINLSKNHIESFSFDFKGSSDIEFSKPLRYLYEPNKAILKAGGYHHISKLFKVSKLHISSHLFTSKKLIEFPGRKFHIVETMPFNNKLMKRFVNQKVNISTRNFPMKVADLKKRFKIKDGGDQYLFFTTDLGDNHIVVVCEKIK